MCIRDRTESGKGGKALLSLHATDGTIIRYYYCCLLYTSSQDEAAHLIRKVTGKQVTEFEQLTVEEQEKDVYKRQVIMAGVEMSLSLRQFTISSIVIRYAL